MYKLRILLVISLLMISSCSTMDAMFGPEAPEVAVAPSKEKIVSDNTKLETEISALRGSLQQLKSAIASKKSIKAEQFARAQAAQKSVEQVQKSVPKDRLWVTVSFRSGYMELTKDSSKALKRLAAKFLSKDRKQTIEVRGYTDDEPIGGYAYSRHKPRHPYKSNLALSKARAHSVADALISAGLSAKIVHTRGFGASDYVADNKTNAGRQKNRRSEIHLISQ